MSSPSIYHPRTQRKHPTAQPEPGNPYRSHARLASNDELHADREELRWLLNDGTELDSDSAQLMRWQLEAAEAELERRTRAGKNWPQRLYGYAAVDIDRVRTAVPVEVLAAEVVDLKRSGRTFRGPCPWHGGSNPTSLVIWPSSGRWRCWSCGMGGDVLAWIMVAHRCDFTTALRRLADRAGIPWPQRPPIRRGGKVVHR